MSEVISSFKSLRVGSQVFAYVGSVYVGGYGGLSESRLCIFRELCPVSFHVVCESPSVLL